MYNYSLLIQYGINSALHGKLYVPLKKSTTNYTTTNVTN